MDSIESIVKHPLVIETLAQTEEKLQQFSRVQIVFFTAIFCYLFFKFLSFFEDNELNKAKILSLLFRYFIKLPFIRGFVSKQMEDVDKTIVEKCREIYGDSKFLVQLPEKKMFPKEILDLFEKYESLSKIDYRQGRVSGAVYSKMKNESIDLIREIYGRTAYANPLHPEVFPGITKMEAEIIRMAINLFNGDENCCGSVTSGGTESIVLAIKAYRDYARNVRGITRPELVAPNTAHAAFQKACQYFCIKFKPIPVNPKTFEADVKSMERAITSRTIALVGSACGYPHGTIDDIQSIAKLGQKYNIPVHVDCCLGGFLVPFTKDAGYPIEPVDFSVKGVTSISADTHKYGYAPKGTSLIMYSDKKYRKHQFSVQTDWPGGIYASPTIAGSRCGANIATCWASMLSYGYEGYVEATREILSTQRYLKSEIEKIHGIHVMGNPKLSVVAVASDHFNIFRLTDYLTGKGWNINPLQFPSGFHICLTLMHVQPGIMDAFLEDLRDGTAMCMKEPGAKVEGTGVIYGMAQSIPDRSMVSDIACLYLNSIYDTDDGKKD